MKHCLLILGIVVMLAVGAPAYSQYIFMDVDGNGMCDGLDVITSATTSVDIWIDTNHDAAGVMTTCPDAGSPPLDMFGYNVIVHAGGAGTVTYNGWSNAIATWTVLEAFRSSGNDASVGFVAPGAALAPGAYKVGSFSISASGDPALSFLTNNSSLGGLGAPFTGFGGSCSGGGLLFVYDLGGDFSDACGTSAGTDVKSTTWGTIKNLYR